MDLHRRTIDMVGISKILEKGPICKYVGTCVIIIIYLVDPIIYLVDPKCHDKKFHSFMEPTKPTHKPNPIAWDNK